MVSKKNQKLLKNIDLTKSNYLFDLIELELEIFESVCRDVKKDARELKKFQVCRRKEKLLIDPPTPEESYPEIEIPPIHELIRVPRKPYFRAPYGIRGPYKKSSLKKTQSKKCVYPYIEQEISESDFVIDFS